MNRKAGFVSSNIKRIAIALVATGFICASYNAIAEDFDLGGGDFDGGDFDGGDFDGGDVDIGDTVIIDDSVNIYDGGGRGRGRRKNKGGGGDAAGAAIVGFMGGMVVNEMMQDKGRPAQAPQRQASAPPPPRATARAEPTLEQRLEEIENLRGRGILSDSEYNAKRRAIIDSY